MKEIFIMKEIWCKKCYGRNTGEKNNMQELKK